MEMRTKNGNDCLNKVKMNYLNEFKRANILLPDKIISDKGSFSILLDEIAFEVNFLKDELLRKGIIGVDCEEDRDNEKKEMEDKENEEDEDIKEFELEEEYEEDDENDNFELNKYSKEDIEFIISHSNKTEIKKSKETKKNQSSSMKLKVRKTNIKEHLSDILLNSEKYNLVSNKIKITNISLLFMTECGLFVTCRACNKAHFNITVKALYYKSTLLYNSTICSICNSVFYVIIKPEINHIENLYIISEVFSYNCRVNYYLPSFFEGTCDDCGFNSLSNQHDGNENDYDNHHDLNHKGNNPIPNSNNTNDMNNISNTTKRIYHQDKILYKNTIPNITYYSKCPICFKNNSMNIGNVYIIKKTILASRYLDYINTITDKISSIPIENSTKIEMKRNVFSIHEPGKSLSLKGSCIHFKNSHRWFRFPCCNRIYPCPVCHSLNEEHDVKFALTCICGNCSYEQLQDNTKCDNCSSYLSDKFKPKSLFWEGGKGQEDKSKMSKNDNHKFTGINKTISRKRLEKEKEKEKKK